TIKLLYTEFYYDGHLGVRNQDLLMEPSLNQVNSPSPASQPPPPPPITPASLAQTSSQLVQHYVQRLLSIKDTMDMERDITNHEEVPGALRRTHELCEKHVPVLSIHNLCNKRARQC
ncbi:hypothetical protein BG011_000368, partial [Mortierella polycephala]